MKNKKLMLSFGPVPSRRLGHSIGINNIPPKTCTYSCIYCQLGRTHDIQTERRIFYKTKEIFDSVKNKIKKTEEKDETIDYLTFVPDGEPTLDVNLGKEIEILKSLNFKIAVITNSSLLWKKDVQDDLSKADFVSLKIDTINEEIWRRINRPHRLLKISKILSGIIDFSQDFNGELTTETMLVNGVNDKIQELELTANFIKDLDSKKSYISMPTRPPAEKFVNTPSDFNMTMAYNVFKDKSINVEFLTGYEGNAFVFTGNLEEDLLSITSVHPMRQDAVKNFLSKANGDWIIVKKLIDDNKLVEVKYNGKKFYLRKFL